MPRSSWTTRLALTAALLVAVPCALPVSVSSAAADEAKTKAKGKKEKAGKGDDAKAKKKKKRKATVDKASVYWGDAKAFKKPAEVDADRVYAEIAEYKKIRDDDLKPGSVQYELLLSKASRRFLAAVKKAAKKHGYDLVAMPGSVKNADSVADISQYVIDAL